MKLNNSQLAILQTLMSQPDNKILFDNGANPQAHFTKGSPGNINLKALQSLISAGLLTFCGGGGGGSSVLKSYYTISERGKRLVAKQSLAEGNFP